MKKLLVTNRNGVVPDLSAWFEIVGPNQFEEADALLLWNDAVGENRVMAEQAHLIGKPVFIIQHGFYTSKDTEYEENGAKPLGSHHFLWSDYHAALFARAGVTSENITITGSTLYPYLRPHGSDGETVVFAPAHLSTNPELNRENAEEATRIWDMLNKTPNIRAVAKLVSSEHRPFSFPGNVVASSLTSLNHIPTIIKLLQTAACVVVQDETTFSFLAYAMDVPVVKLSNINSPFSEAPDIVVEDDLSSAVLMAISNPAGNRKERLEAITKMGGNPRTVRPIQAIVDAIKSIIEVPICA